MIEYIWQDLIFPLLLNLIQQQPRQLNNKFFSGEMSCKMPPAAWCRKYTLILLIAVPVPHWGGSKDPHREFQAIPSGLGWAGLSSTMSPGGVRDEGRVKGEWIGLVGNIKHPKFLPPLGHTELQMFLCPAGKELGSASYSTKPRLGLVQLSFSEAAKCSPKRRILGDWNESDVVSQLCPQGLELSCPSSITKPLSPPVSHGLQGGGNFFKNVIICKKISVRSKLLQAAAHTGVHRCVVGLEQPGLVRGVRIG